MATIFTTVVATVVAVGALLFIPLSLMVGKPQNVALEIVVLVVCVWYIARVMRAGPTLLVTCDCGSSDHERLAAARAAGIDCVVIDHHLVPAEPLPAIAFLNPHRADCGFPYKGLASCGLALSLLVLLVAQSLLVLYLAYALLGLGFSALSSALNAAATLSVAAAEQGAVAGLLAAAPVAGMLIGPLVATALYALSPTWPLALGAASCVAMGAVFLRRRV